MPGQPLEIAGPQTAPFADYLRPTQPRPIDQPMSGATGWETGPVAAGQLALGFLQGIRKNRVADFLEQDKNAEAGLRNFQSHVANLAQDPNLTDEGRQAVMDAGNRIMNQHMQYEVRDVPKNGVGGFFKNLLVNMTGGPIKTRDPINWNEATGELTNIARQHSQKDNFAQAVQESQTVLDQLKRTNPNPSAEDVQQALRPAYLKVLQTAPNYAQAFAQTMAMGFPSAGSVQYALGELNRTQPGAAPPTGAPPQAPPELNYSPVAGYSPAQQPTAQVRPAESVQVGGDYLPGYGPQRFAALSNVAGLPRSPVNITQPTLVNLNGRRVMASMVMGSTNQNDNGYWDVSTGQKIAGPVTRESLEGASMRVGADGIVRAWNPEKNQWQITLDDKGQPMRQSQALVGYTDATGNTVYGTRADAVGRPTSQQGAQVRRTADEIRKARAAGYTEAQTRLDSRVAAINKAAGDMITGIRKNQLEIATQGAAGLGLSLDKAAIDAAIRQNPAALITEVEQHRRQQLDDAQRFWQNERRSIDENYPEQAPATAAPPPAPRSVTPAPAAAAPAPATAAPPRVPVPSAASFDSLFKKK